jgi:hypothetical protein
MIKLDSISPSLTLPSASPLDMGPARRLMVLIPGVETDYTLVIHRVWELAHALECDVLFLGLCRDASEGPRLRRSLITMSALVHDGWVSAEVKVEIGNDWLKVVKSNWQEGDVIVCFAEQHVGLLHRPLSQILESNLKVPLYVLSSLDPQKSNSDRLLQVVGWSGSIGIIIGFGILQTKIVQLPEDWFQSVVFILSIIPEFWLIWTWNNLFS